MHFRSLTRTFTAAAALAALTACENSLEVENLDQPDVERAFSTPDGIEAIIGNGFSQILGATHATSTALQPAAMVMSLESYGSVANFGMNLRATIPRAPIDNTRGNATEAENHRDFRELSLRGRTISDAIRALDALIEDGGSLGSASDNARARSFGFFTLGISNAHLALMYDSAGVSRPALGPGEVPPLSHYNDAMATALAQFDSALAIANTASAAGNSFSIPDTWVRTTGEGLSFTEYVQLVRSAKARYRAGVARNPEERAAVDWAAVVADAEAGIQQDLTLEMNANEGWSNAWLSQAMVFIGWHGMSPYVIGMADTSSGYANWVGQPRASRSAFLIHTPDERFPKGATRAEQEAASPGAAAVLPDIYFRARPPGGDTPGEPWGASPYDFIRFRAYRTNASIGPWVWMSATEVAMLRAEGLIRLNRAPEAVPIINASRVENNLPPFASATDRAPAHPGGSATSCVPRTPTGANNALECGSLFEAMKWEKRMESLFTGYAQWFTDSRGWGDLPLGTALMWPVPYQEMDARRQAFYSSQEGPEWRAATSTYGFGVGNN